ncbi:MAG TPA: hypothetical protein VFX59_12875 [Polyangiales bacterium]|nr:hypothetical protein [Polyangiales bacterium]
MKLGVLGRDGVRSLLLRLQGTGYASDQDSNRYKEVDAVAAIAAKVLESIEQVMPEAFLAFADRALDRHERVRYFVQGASRSITARRSRLVAFAQALPKMTPARLARAAATLVGASTGSTQRPSLAQLLAHRASPLGALFVTRREPAATDPLVRRDLVPILERGLPASAICGQVTTKDAVYGDALDPAGIKLQPVVTLPAQTKARVAPLEVYPGMAITREQWIELQASLCWKSFGFDIDQDAQGRWLFVGATLSSGGTSVDSSINWSARFVSVWGVAGAGPLDDPTTLGRDAHVWLPPAKTGAAGSGFYVHELCDTEYEQNPVGITVEVNGAGSLIITNTTGGQRTVRLMLRASPRYLLGSNDSTQPWIDKTQIQHDDLKELYASTMISDASDPGKFAGVSAGALRRVVYSGPLFKVADQGIPQGVILDSSEDWRNRWVLVVPMQNGVGFGPDGGNYFPVIGADGMLRNASQPQAAPRAFFTGAGQPMGSGTVLAYQHPCSIIANDVTNAWLFADTDGNLCCEMKDPASHNQCATLLLLVIATEQTTGTSVVTPVPVHATQVQTIDLEQPQNCGLYAQGRQGGVPRYLLSDAAPKARPTCPPLGVISEGHSPVRPAKWEIRERLGALDDGTWERRQPIAHQRRRLVSLFLPAHGIVPVDDFNVLDELVPGVNDQMDFRDRFVWVEGRWSTDDISISNPVQASDVAGSPFVALMYTGPGPGVFDVDFDLLLGPGGSGYLVRFEFTRRYPGGGFHSRLLLVNTTNVAIWVNAAIEASGFLGCTDRRAYGRAP